ncbi:PH domain-containing protein [Mucilaginibacter terrae]|uniref:PH domain-containing protein n=1 Tax=Mucilaginibacter terrae TaxID=1955052 RepID=UPI00363DDF62
MVHALLTTNYVVNEQILTIKWVTCLILKIDIDTIKKIRQTNNALSSPAASLNRLNVSYRKFDDAMISPKDQAAFISHLMLINPAIEVVYKQRGKASAA